MLKVYLTGNAVEGQQIGARDLSDPNDPYIGPSACVTFDDDWLYIVTEPAEGAVMINIETLPKLRQALSRIAHALTKRSAPHENMGSSLTS